jgi:CRISPR system Cascade subunit CasC
VEDDYFTAVDDLNDGNDDLGAAHIGEAGFAAALFYSYICIDKGLLIDNLGGNQALAEQALRALIETAVKVSPKGKQNSFASRAYASYVLVEKGRQQPRSLSVAFLKAVDDKDMASAAIDSLQQHYANLDHVYGDCADQRYSLNALTGEGRLTELLDFIAS